MQYTNEQRRPSFKEEMRKIWRAVEQVVILAMLHHGDLFEETEGLLAGDRPRLLGGAAATHEKELKEQLKAVGK